MTDPLEIALRSNFANLRVTIETPKGNLDRRSIKAAIKFLDLLRDIADEDFAQTYDNSALEAITGCLDAPLN